MYSPVKGKEAKPAWRDRRGAGGGRSRGRSYGGYSGSSGGEYGGGKHDRFGGNVGERWEDFPSFDGNQLPNLTLEILENRLKEERAIFPTPTVTPCYSLDEFNYPATPQWYLKSINAFNKRMGHRGRERGGGAWREGPPSDGILKMADNLGYQYAAVVPPGPVVAATTAAVRPTPLFNRVESLGPIQEQPPFNTGTLTNFGPLHSDPSIISRPMTGHAGPFPINTGPPLVNNARPPLVQGVPMVPQSMAHPINGLPHQVPLAPPAAAIEQMPKQSTAMPPTIGPLPIRPLFESKGQFPNLEEGFRRDSSQSIDEPREGDLIIAKEDDDDNDDIDEGNKIDYDDVTPSPSPPPFQRQEHEQLKPALSVSTVSTLSLGRKGRQTILGHALNNKRGSGKQQKSTKRLIVSINLSDVHLPGEDNLETAVNPVDDEAFNYDDYLEQLNDEEEDEKPFGFNADFWIDTKPRSDSNSRSDSRDNADSTGTSVTSEQATPLQLFDNPLDEEFPAIGDDSRVNTNGKAAEMTLRSLLDDGTVDKSIIVEEGKVNSYY